MGLKRKASWGVPQSLDKLTNEPAKNSMQQSQDGKEVESSVDRQLPNFGQEVVSKNWSNQQHYDDTEAVEYQDHCVPGKYKCHTLVHSEEVQYCNL